MATTDSSGVQRRRVRLDGNRPRTRPSLRSWRKPGGKPFTLKAGSRGPDLQTQLAEITRRLKVIGAIAVTTEVALRAQNCEQDADIAECLRYGVVDALTTQIERLSQLCPLVAEHAP